MEQQPITTTTSKGIIISLLIIVITLAGYFMGMITNSAFGWVGYAIFIIGIIISVTMYGKQINYNSKFGNYFAHGFKVTAVVTVIIIIFMAVFYIVFPEVKELMIDKIREGMLKDGNVSEEQIETGLEMTRKFFMVATIGGTLFFYMFLGTLAALVGAAITKKQPANVTDMNQIR